MYRMQNIGNPQEDSFDNFIQRFKLLAERDNHIVVNTLSNIFTMRLIGNKTHGDLAEVGITEFINQFMTDYRAIHVGKNLFRAKEREEDIVIINNKTNKEFPVSLKAYGNGPLQLSTDSDQKMFPYLESQGQEITEKNNIDLIFNSPAFDSFLGINMLSFIYDETERKCNIMVFDHEKAMRETAKIIYVGKGESFNGKGHGRKHPIYLFLDKEDKYICEVRYGGASANALQRGLWTNTKNALNYFDSITNGWIDYTHNNSLVNLFSLALNASKTCHDEINFMLLNDIQRLTNEEPNGTRRNNH